METKVGSTVAMVGIYRLTVNRGDGKEPNVLIDLITTTAGQNDIHVVSIPMRYVREASTSAEALALLRNVVDDASSPDNLFYGMSGTPDDVLRRYLSLSGLRIVTEDEDNTTVRQHPTTVAPDGTVRQVYYGDGEQPWDVMVRQGWAASFAVGSVLKYLRRDKGDRSGDLKKARWYYRALTAMRDGTDAKARVDATLAICSLMRELVSEETSILALMVD